MGERNGLQKIITNAELLDRRRQQQIQNQIEIINRLAAANAEHKPWTYDSQLMSLVEDKSRLQLEVEDLRAQLKELRQ